MDMRLFRFSFFAAALLLIVVLFPSQHVSAGTSISVVRGGTTKLNWQLSGGLQSCQGDTTYPAAFGGVSDGVRSAWLGTHSGTTGFVSLTPNPSGVALPVVYSFTCTDAVSSATDSTTLTVTDCAAGTAWNGSSCVSCSNGAINPLACDQCPSGMAFKGGSCVACSGNPAPTGCTGPGGSKGNPLGSLVCNNGANNPTNCNAFPPAPPTATLSASPSTIDSGQSSTLTWSSNHATSCTSFGGFSTGGDTSGNASTGALASTQNYQMSCTGAGGTVNSNIATVTVLQPQASITANPARLRKGDTSSVISWSANRVKSCVVTGPSGTLASGNADGSKNFSSGSPRTVPISTQSTFTITCQTGGAPVTASVVVNVPGLFQEF